MTRRFLLAAVISTLMLMIAACEIEDAGDDAVAVDSDDTEEVVEPDDSADDAAVEEATEADDTDEVEEPAATPEATATPEPTPEPEPTPTPEPVADPRENPLQFGETAVIGDWEVRVLDTIPDATEMILAENQFNDPPAEGYQFFIARIEAVYNGEEYDRFDGSYSLRTVGEEAVTYRTFGNSCGVIPDELDDPEVYTGGAISGNVCWQIRSSDADSLLMFYDEFLGSGERQFMALYEGEPREIPDPGDPPGEPIDDEVGTRDNPAPAGWWIDLGDGWHIRVLNSTPNATQQVLDNNQFNDAPAEGFQFFMTEIEATYFGSGSDRFDGSFRLRTVGAEAVTYSTFNNTCGSIPNSMDDPEVFPGGAISGNICWEVSSADADSLVMFDDAFLSSADRIYMALMN